MSGGALAASPGAPGSAAGRHARALIALAGLVVIWGLSVPLTKLGLRDYPPLMLTGLRFLAAVPCFTPVLIRRPLPSPRALLAMAALGLVGVGIGQTAQNLGIERSAASVASVISAAIPIFVVALAALRFHQPVRSWQAGGLALAFLGIGLVAFGGPASGGAGLNILGPCLVLLSAAAIALYYVLGSELAGTHGVLTVSAWSSVFGALALLPVTVWQAAEHGVSLAPRGIAIVLYLGVLVTAAGVPVWMHVLRALPARIGASSQYLQPLVAVAASAALLGEAIGPQFAAGTILVLTGIALTAWPQRRR